MNPRPLLDPSASFVPSFSRSRFRPVPTCFSFSQLGFSYSSALWTRSSTRGFLRRSLATPRSPVSSVEHLYVAILSRWILLMDAHTIVLVRRRYIGIGYRLYRIGWVKFVRGIHGLGPVQVRAVVAILLYYMVALNDEIRSCLKIRNDGVRMVKREIVVKSVRSNIWRMSNGSLLRFVRLIHFVWRFDGRGQCVFMWHEKYTKYCRAPSTRDNIFLLLLFFY